MAYSVMARLALYIFYLHLKFGDTRYSHNGIHGDMIVGDKIENGPCDHDQAPFRGDLSSAC